MKRISLITIAVLLLFLSLQASAADVSVKLLIDRQEASQSDAIRLEVTIEGTATVVTLPLFRGWSRLSSRRGGLLPGWNSSTAA